MVSWFSFLCDFSDIFALCVKSSGTEKRFYAKSQKEPKGAKRNQRLPQRVRFAGNVDYCRIPSTPALSLSLRIYGSSASYTKLSIDMISNQFLSACAALSLVASVFCFAAPAQQQLRLSKIEFVPTSRLSLPAAWKLARWSILQLSM